MTSLSPDDEKRRRHRRERIIAAAVVLIIAAGVFIVVLGNRREAEELHRNTTYVPRETKVTAEVKLLQEYVRIDTTNPPGNELAAARWLEPLIKAAGVETEIIESAPGRANLYARIKGENEGDGLLLLHHLDVVPATAEGWTRPPFAGEIHLDQLYGRGTVDVKGPGICFLRAFLDVAKAGRRPKRDIVFLAVADEETGGALGTRWLIQNRPDVFAGIRYALNEGGITEMRQEKITYYGVEIGTKLPVIVNLRARTREALQRARIALEPWFIARDPGPVSPEVRAFFKQVAPQRTQFRAQLADIDRAIADGQFWRLPIGYRELTQNTVWVGGITAAEDGRSFTARATLLSPPDVNPDERLRWLSNQIKPYGVQLGEIVRKETPVPLSSTDTPLYRLIASDVMNTWGAPVGTEILNGSYNDSRFLRARGIVAYGINPFPVDFFQSDSIHKSDERLRVDYFVQGVEFTRKLVGRFAFEK